jgi:hypothetical protein
VLDKIGALTYPKWLSDTVPFLPELDLTCVSTSGRGFLEEAAENSTSATVTGFFDAILAGCSSDALLLSGGYDGDKEEMELNVIFNSSVSGSL